MTAARHPVRPFRFLLVALPLAFALSACESMQDMNPFAEKQTPLPGDRRPLFPEGVPGVEPNAPPQQPMNSNIPIPSQLGAGETPPPAAEEPETKQAARALPAKGRAGGSAQPQPDPDDAWSGTR
jgi:hypothetical protein